MEPLEQSRAAERTAWCRCAFEYTIGGDLRFISHHDTLRLFQRAVARAALPVRCTEGFNPHPRMMIPLPRPVGVTSQAETLVVEFAEWIDPDEVLGRLRREMPAGLNMLAARLLRAKESLRPMQVRYRLNVGGRRQADLEVRARRMLEADVLEVERPISEKGRSRTVDVRPYLVDMRVDGEIVEFVLRVTGAGTARPAEIAGLLGYDSRTINHRIHRLEIRWQQQE